MSLSLGLRKRWRASALIRSAHPAGSLRLSIFATLRSVDLRLHILGAKLYLDGRKRLTAGDARACSTPALPPVRGIATCTPACARNKHARSAHSVGAHLAPPLRGTG